MATPGQWIAGARPRTLPNAVVPVMVGTGVAFGLGAVGWWQALVALAVALLLQIGVNYANDYSDGVRGTDDQRVGPMRLVGSRAATPRQVLTAALGCFAAAAVAGLTLVIATRAWWILTLFRQGKPQVSSRRDHRDLREGRPARGRALLRSLVGRA
ncbi:1,4-dihydroxy-2-naphthoate octaprenyltransferase, partial [Nonomuraea sp. NPDC055795]